MGTIIIICIIIGVVYYLNKLGIFKGSTDETLETTNASEPQESQAEAENASSAYNSVYEKIIASEKSMKELPTLSDEADVDVYADLFTETLLEIIFTVNLSIREKFLLLEQFETRIGEFAPEGVYTPLYSSTICAAYDAIYKEVPTATVAMTMKNKLEEGIKAKTTETFIEDFNNLFAFMALASSTDDDVTISSSDYDDLLLPEPIYED